MIQRLALAAPLVLLLATAAAAGVHLVPGATRADVVPDGRSRALLAWELPEGLLVVDRRGADRTEIGGDELTPRFDDGAWYLVDRARAPRTADPAAFGHVHLAGATAWVVEVPRARVDAFLAAGLTLQYLDRSPLAPARAVSPPAAAALREVDPALKTEYLDALDQQAYDRLIRELSGDLAFWHDGGPQTITTRYYSTAGNDLAAAHLADKLAGYGYTVELDEFTASGHLCRNVVATLPGSVSPGEIVVVGGHFDSTSPQAGTDAPGAEDNASGTSLVMELARASAGREFERTVQFVLFDAEEIGLRGSQHYVDEAVSEGRTIVAAITADMVAWYDRAYGVVIEGETEWEWLMTAMADNVMAHTDIAHEKTYHSWGSDHVPFQQAGIPAFLAIDMDWSEYPYYHSTDDTWANIEATAHLGLQIARAAAGTLADVAGLMGEVTGAPAPSASLVRLTAYPNPFNPRTTFAFSLVAPARGELALFDVRGRRVVTLASGEFPAGEHVATWDGRDADGRAVPGGTYVARLEAGSERLVRKTVLAR